MNFKLLLYLLFFSNKVNSLIVRRVVKSSLSGLEIGIATFGTGLIMDNTISKKSLIKLNNQNKNLYKQGLRESFKNLIIVGPSYYFLLDKYIIQDHESIINILQIFQITCIHSIGYYLSHRLMHRNDLFRKYHIFHHQFNDTLVPSIGNAVSQSEFTFAYMTPFVISIFLVNPNVNSFNFGIIIISFMNLVIHTQEFTEVKYNELFVSPKTHINHHQGNNIKKTYSAPIFNLEYIYDKFKR